MAVKQQLRLRAASHQTSMEAEARAILAESLATDRDQEKNQRAAKAERRERIAACLGMWQDRYQGKATDEVMQELRGDG